MDLNKAMVIGNVTRDPELRSTATGASVTNFSVATNLVWTDANGQKQEKVEFHNIVAWRKLADVCAQYLKKGKKVYVEGRLQTRSWDDPNGTKKYMTEIVADNIIFLSPLNTQGYGASVPPPAQPQASVPPQQQPTAPPAQPSGFDNVSAPIDTPPAPPTVNPDDEIKVEDIPF